MYFKINKEPSAYGKAIEKRSRPTSPSIPQYRSEAFSFGSVPALHKGNYVSSPPYTSMIYAFFAVLKKCEATLDKT